MRHTTDLLLTVLLGTLPCCLYGYAVALCYREAGIIAAACCGLGVALSFVAAVRGDAN